VSSFDREYYINLIEESYFGNVSKEDITGACDCFTDDSKVVIYHGDNPVRLFYKEPKGNQQPLEVFYDHLLGNYNAKFQDFVHTIDLSDEKCASNFLVTLSPKPNSEYLSTGVLTLNNSNFFRLDNGKINYMIIYYANPTLGDLLGNTNDSPTGFPKF
jgi:hypothetical protein